MMVSRALWILVITYGAAVLTVICWQLPASVVASRLEDLDEEFQIEDRARVALQAGERPTALPSQDALLIGGYAAFLSPQVRNVLSTNLAPWQAARLLFGLDRRAERSDWSHLSLIFATATGGAVLFLWLVAATVVGAAAIPLGGWKGLAWSGWPLVRKALLIAIAITPPLAMAVAFRDYGRKQFFGPPIPAWSSLGIIAVLALSAGALAGLWLGRRARVRVRRRHRVCLQCDYDLAGQPNGRCPECGLASQDTRRYILRRGAWTVASWWGWVALALLVVLSPMLVTLVTHEPTPGYPCRRTYVERWLTLWITNDDDSSGRPCLRGDVHLAGMERYSETLQQRLRGGK